MTITDLYYVACFTADEGVYSCGHNHGTVREAMECLIPDGRGFLRAHDNGVFRSLDNQELIDFLESLPEMPWSACNAVRKGGDAVNASYPLQTR